MANFMASNYKARMTLRAGRGGEVLRRWAAGFLRRKGHRALGTRGDTGQSLREIASQRSTTIWKTTNFGIDGVTGNAKANAAESGGSSGGEWGRS